MTAENATGDPFPWLHPINAVLLSVVGLVSSAVYFLLPSSVGKESTKSHVLITGGSSGIGFSLAERCCEEGAENITLIARNVEKLKKAQGKLQEKYAGAKIHIHSVDVTSYEAVEKAIPSILQGGGPPTIVFNNAGVAKAAAFKSAEIDDFESLMKLNYLGSVYVTKALIPYLGSGSTLVYTSSMAGQLGVFGYTAYTPTKFALRGFCESLQMELRRDGIRVIMAFPPDTDTPGFAAENEGKPKETHLISEAGGLFEPEAVARAMLQAATSSRPPFNIYFGLEGWMLSTLTAGMSPVHNLLDALCQVFLMSLLRFVSLFYLWDFTNIIAKCGRDDKKEK